VNKREREQALRRLLTDDVAERVLKFQTLAKALRREGRVRKRKDRS
jgi:hypothetical protein